MTHGAPYHHFPSKAALVVAVAEEGYRVLHAAQTEAAARAGDDPVARLAALGDAYVRFALGHPGHFRVMFRADLADWRTSPTLAAAAQETMMQLTTTVNAVIQNEKLDADLMELTLAAWSVAHGLSTLWVDGPLRRSRVFEGERSFEDLAARVTLLSTQRLYGETKRRGGPREKPVKKRR